MHTVEAELKRPRRRPQTAVTRAPSPALLPLRFAEQLLLGPALRPAPSGLLDDAWQLNRLDQLGPATFMSLTGALGRRLRVRRPPREPLPAAPCAASRSCETARAVAWPRPMPTPCPCAPAPAPGRPALAAARAGALELGTGLAGRLADAAGHRRRLAALRACGSRPTRARCALLLP